jgi:hypothetical protein
MGQNIICVDVGPLPWLSGQPEPNLFLCVFSILSDWLRNYQLNHLTPDGACDALRTRAEPGRNG